MAGDGAVGSFELELAVRADENAGHHGQGAEGGGDHVAHDVAVVVLAGPDEAAHGTVTRHYYKYLKGEATSTNPMATIFAWSGALKKRGELDSLPDLVHFGEALEAASLQTLNDGIMTKDLCGLAEGITPTPVDSLGFIRAIRERLEKKF